MYNGQFQFDPNDVWFNFASTEYIDMDGRAEVKSGDVCILRDATYAKIGNLEKRLSDYGVDTWNNDNRAPMPMNYRPEEFKTCTLLALNTLTSKDVNLKIELDYCTAQNGIGFGLIPLDSGDGMENMDMCFKLLDTIEDHVQILPGAPILCGGLGYVGRV